MAPEREIIRWAIYQGKGILTEVLKYLGWDIMCKTELMRWAVKYRLNNDFIVARNDIIDKSEQNMYNAVLSRDIEASKFVLKTVGKGRGWHEKVGIDGEDDKIYSNIVESSDKGKAELADIEGETNVEKLASMMNEYLQDNK